MDHHVRSAHMLGDRDVLLELERERDAAAFAKDQVLAHRERDRHQARLAGRLGQESQKVSVRVVMSAWSRCAWTVVAAITRHPRSPLLPFSTIPQLYWLRGASAYILG